MYRLTHNTLIYQHLKKSKYQKMQTQLETLQQDLIRNSNECAVLQATSIEKRERKNERKNEQDFRDPPGRYYNPLSTIHRTTVL